MGGPGRRPKGACWEPRRPASESGPPSVRIPVSIGRVFVRGCPRVRGHPRGRVSPGHRVRSAPRVRSGTRRGGRRDPAPACRPPRGGWRRPHRSAVRPRANRAGPLPSRTLQFRLRGRARRPASYRTGRPRGPRQDREADREADRRRRVRSFRPIRKGHPGRHEPKARLRGRHRHLHRPVSGAAAPNPHSCRSHRQAPPPPKPTASVTYKPGPPPRPPRTDGCRGEPARSATPGRPCRSRPRSALPSASAR